VANLFERLSAGQPPPGEKPTPQQVPLAAGMLLGWLQNNWKKSVIRVRDVQRLGPHSIRDRESAVKMVEILASGGWLVPTKPHRCDSKQWRIAIGD
jgi:hypothetical protein